jgi:hypothetical protein
MSRHQRFGPSFVLRCGSLHSSSNTCMHLQYAYMFFLIYDGFSVCMIHVCWIQKYIYIRTYTQSCIHDTYIHTYIHTHVHIYDGEDGGAKVDAHHTYSPVIIGDQAVWACLKHILSQEQQHLCAYTVTQMLTYEYTTRWVGSKVELIRRQWGDVLVDKVAHRHTHTLSATHVSDTCTWHIPLTRTSFACGHCTHNRIIISSIMFVAMYETMCD